MKHSDEQTMVLVRGWLLYATFMIFEEEKPDPPEVCTGRHPRRNRQAIANPGGSQVNIESSHHDIVILGLGEGNK